MVEGGPGPQLPATGVDFEDGGGSGQRVAEGVAVAVGGGHRHTHVLADGEVFSDAAGGAGPGELGALLQVGDSHLDGVPARAGAVEGLDVDVVDVVAAVIAGRLEIGRLREAQRTVGAGRFADREGRGVRPRERPVEVGDALRIRGEVGVEHAAAVLGDFDLLRTAHRGWARSRRSR